ncbi:MAG TPA: hypothetical protein VG709_00875 [Actinomycetota bacterium]|nr:hypothetical protein [Actinomycetota bacterium]
MEDGAMTRYADLPLNEIEEPPERYGRPRLDAEHDLPADVAELRDAVGGLSAVTARTLMPLDAGLAARAD